MKTFLRIFLIMIAALITSCSNGACNTNTQTASVDLDSNNGGISNGESNVALTPTIVLQFSVPMDPSTVNA